MLTIYRERPAVSSGATDNLKVRPEWVLWLRRQIEKSGDSNREIGRKIGMSHTSVANLMDLEYLRENQPTTDTCKKLAALFNTDPDLVSYLAKHRDEDPRKSLKVREDVAQLQQRVFSLNNLENEDELQKAIRLMNGVLDNFLPK